MKISKRSLDLATRKALSSALTYDNTTPMPINLRTCRQQSKCLLILALVDYASRAHEIEIRPSTVRPSSVSQISLYLMRDFLSNFSCSFPWAIRSDIFFLIFERKKNKHFPTFFYDFVCFRLHGTQRIFFRLLLNFLLNGPDVHCGFLLSFEN